MLESNVLRHVWLAVAATSVLFRVQTGKAWVSSLGPKAIRRLNDGSIVIPAARPVALGFGRPNGDPVVGTHDLVGWTSIVITPEMVGMTVAVLTTIETKHSDGGTRTEEQVSFCEAVRAAGGISGFASSPDMAQRIIFDYRNRPYQK